MEVRYRAGISQTAGCGKKEFANPKGILQKMAFYKWFI